MKKLFTLFTLTFLLQTGWAQVTSTDCLEEVKAVYAQLDHEKLLAGADQMQFDFTHSYIMRLDEEGKKVTGEESLVLGPKFMYYNTPEFTECSDASEAFNYRKYQYLVYRTKSSLGKSAPIIPGADKGVLSYCMVKECNYVPAPGNDTLRYKHALLAVNEEGQKKYPLRSMEFVWNPWNGQPITIGVDFTDRSLWKWARWDFHTIGKVAAALPTDVKSNLLDANGELLARFKGSEVLDYR